MSNKAFSVSTPKDFSVNENGEEVKKTAWNKVGMAWHSKSGECLNVELFMFPNQKFVINLSEKSNENQSNEVPF